MSVPEVVYLEVTWRADQDEPTAVEISECGTCGMTIPWHAPSCPWREVRPVEDALEGAE